MKVLKASTLALQIVITLLCIAAVILAGVMIPQMDYVNWEVIAPTHGIFILQVIFTTIYLFRRWKQKRVGAGVRYSSLSATFLAVGVIVLILVKGGPVSSNPRSFTIPLNSEAPVFAAHTLDGKDFHLADYKGKYVFLDFWATWCLPCVKDLPYVQKLYEEVGDEVVVVGINYDQLAAVANKHVEEEGVEFLQLHDPERNLWEIYNIQALPKNYLINPEGIVVEQNLHEEDIVTVITEYARNN